MFLLPPPLVDVRIGLGTDLNEDGEWRVKDLAGSFEVCIDLQQRFERVREKRRSRRRCRRFALLNGLRSFVQGRKSGPTERLEPHTPAFEDEHIDRHVDGQGRSRAITSAPKSALVKDGQLQSAFFGRPDGFERGSRQLEVVRAGKTAT